MCKFYSFPLLGTFTKLWKRPLSSSCLSVSVCMKQLSSHWTDFQEIFIFEYLFKSIEKIQVSLKFWQELLLSYMKTKIHFWSYLAHFSLEWEMCQSYRENQNTHFNLLFLFFQKMCYFWDNVEKYCTAGQAGDCNIAHAHCMLDPYLQTHSQNM